MFFDPLFTEGTLLESLSKCSLIEKTCYLHFGVVGTKFCFRNLRSSASLHFFPSKHCGIAENVKSSFFLSETFASGILQMYILVVCCK